MMSNPTPTQELLLHDNSVSTTPIPIEEEGSLVAPALTDEFYAESYRLRKAASSMTAVTIQLQGHDPCKF